ncbi:MAG: hypothetical protein IJB17_05205, partial [Oscillospiraceae bacterium]|nr:hypothetical protein [Oscillospiraceae bacterium]
MKKYIAWILVCAMLLSVLAGCNQDDQPGTVPTTEPTGATTEPVVDADGLQNAIEYIRTVYEEAPLETPRDFTRIASVVVGAERYQIVWSVDVAEDLVKIVPGEGNMVTIDVNENVAEETPYVLTATITDAAGNSASASWNHVIPLPVDYSEIVNAAYELKPGEAMDEEVTLQGVITSINTPYDSSFKNITVTIQVGDMADKPIMCYRLKGEGADTLLMGDTITVYGIIKNYNGTIEFDAGCELIEVIKGDGEVPVCPEDPKQIVDEAYALGKGQTLPYLATLTGKVTAVKEPYTDQYKNITVTIKVDGRSSKPIVCYRIKGELAPTVNVNDIITVEGYITNYNGTIEFAAGSKLIAVEDKAPPAVITDLAKIWKDAQNLDSGDQLSYEARVKGTITQVNYAYDPNYDNITVTIKLENGQTIGSRYMSGSGVSKIGVGDDIVVQGYIENYEGKRQFIRAKMIDYTINRTDAPEDPLQIVEDAYGLASGESLMYDAELTGKVISIKEPYTSQYKNATFTIEVPGAEGKPIVCYRVKGSGLSGLAVGDTVTVEGTITNYNGTIEFTTGSKVSNVVKGDGTEATDPTEPTTDSTDPTAGVTYVDAPVAGTPYKMVMDKAGTVLYFDGATESESVTFRLNSSEDAAVAVDVVLEEVEGVEGGYRLYFMNGNAKTYIRVYERTDGDPGYGKGSLELVTETPAEYYTYDSTYRTLIHTAEDGENAYYLGTYSTYTTFSVSNASYLKADTVDVSQFPARFATVELPEQEEGGDVVTAPAVDTAYKMVMDKLGTVLYFNGATESESITYRLNSSEDASTAVDVKLEAVEGVEGGYRLYFMNGETKTYIRVYERTDGDPGYGKGSLELVTETPAEYYTYNSTYNTLFHTAEDGENAYFMGTYGTYVTFSVSNTSYLKADNVDVSQFPARFVEGVSAEPQPTEPTEESTEPTVPADPAWEMVTSVASGETYKWGIEQGNLGKTIYFAGTMNGYYGATTDNIEDGVDVVLEDANGGYYVSFTDPSGAKKYVNVVVSGTHRNFTIADAPETVYTFDSEYDTLNTDVEGTTCYIGTYNNYNTFSVSPVEKITSSFPS